MANQFLPKCSPIWGFPPNMTIADFPSSNDDLKQFLSAVTTTTTSAAIDMQARGVELVCAFSNNTFTCDIDLMTSISGTDTTVKTFTGVNLLNESNLFAGNLEFIDLQGAPLKVRVYNIANANSGSVSISARVTY